MSGQQVNKSESTRNKTLVALALAVACGAVLAAAFAGALPVSAAVLLVIKVAAAVGIGGSVGYAVGVNIRQARLDATVQVAKDRHAFAMARVEKELKKVVAAKRQEGLPKLHEMNKIRGMTEKKSQNMASVHNELMLKTTPVRKKHLILSLQAVLLKERTAREGQRTARLERLDLVDQALTGAKACRDVQKREKAPFHQELKVVAEAKAQQKERVQNIKNLQAGFVQELNELRGIVELEIESERLAASVQSA